MRYYIKHKNKVPIHKSPAGEFDYVYKIELLDGFGDGWTGNSLDVLVNDVVVLNDITFTSGFGPVPFTFSISNTQKLSTSFNYTGSFFNECYYKIYNQDDIIIYETFTSSQFPGMTGPPNLEAYYSQDKVVFTYIYTEPPVPPIIPFTYSQICTGPGGAFADINLTVNGDNPPFTYQWFSNVGFSATTQDISNLSNGTYWCIITDNIGNTQSTGDIITNCP